MEKAETAEDLIKEWKRFLAWKKWFESLWGNA